MSKLIISDEAEHDIFMIGRFIAKDSDVYASRFIQKLKKLFRLLAERPKIGRVRPEYSPRIRSLPFQPYIIFYQAVEDGVQIIRILHSKRDINNIMRNQ